MNSVIDFLDNLKMNEVREIDFSQYCELDNYFAGRAYDLSKIYRNLEYTNIGSGHFYHSSFVPCVYDEDNDTRKNPKDGKLLKLKKLPKNYRIEEKTGMWNIFHFNPGGCPNLKPFYSVVYCLAKESHRNYPYPTFKYYVGKHRVGECPFKEVG